MSSNYKERVMQKKQKTKPVGLLDPKWRYVPAVSTDILARFRAMGWVPPSEAKNAKTV
jgi:hypothetical protein